MRGAHIGQCLRALSQRRGQSVVSIHGDRKRTGDELVRRIAELSADISSLGVAAGERVALAGLNSDYYLEWLLAVPCAGAIVAPLNHRWSISEAAEAINRIQACLLVIDDSCSEWWEPLRQRCPSLRAAVRMEVPCVRKGGRVVRRNVQNVQTAVKGVWTELEAVRAQGKGVRTESRSLATEVQGVRKEGEGFQGESKGVRNHPELDSPLDSGLASRLSREGQVLVGTCVDREGLEESMLNGDLATAPGGVALICFTSGTTGAPKAAVLSHTALVTQSLAKVAALGYNDRDVYLHAAPLCHIGGISSALGMLMAGATHVFLPRWRVDEAIAAVQMHRVTTFIAVPAMLADVIQAVGHVSGDSDGSPTPFAGIRTLLVGGGAMGCMGADVARLFPNAIIATAYGMTEAASSITFDIVHEPRPRGTALPRWITVEADRAPEAQSAFRDSGKSWAVCVGRPAPHLEIRVSTGDKSSAGPLDSSFGSRTINERLSGSLQSEAESRTTDDPEIPIRQSATVLHTQGDGQPPLSVGSGLALKTGGPAGAHFDPPFREGVIQVRGSNVFLGYWNQPEETAKVLSNDGWFSTGDVGYVDDRGRLWLCGREKDMVKTGGENVHAIEVEAVLCQHPGVVAAAVAGLPDARLGEQVAALLVLAAGWSWGGPVDGRVGRLDAEEMRQHCHRQGLTRYKIPRVFAAQTEPLPMTSSGKVQKNVVRGLLQKHHRNDTTALSSQSKL